MSNKVLKNIQTKRLINTINYAYKNLDYFQKKMKENNVKIDEIKSIDDIVKLPFTRKHELKDLNPFGACAVKESDISRIYFTSGTTGNPLAVSYTKNDLQVINTCVKRLLKNAGIKKEYVVQNSFGYGLFIGGLGMHDGIQSYGTCVIPASSGNDERQISIMVDMQPDVVCCTPSYALHLANMIVSKGYQNKINIKKFLCGGETCSSSMRDTLEELLNVEMYDVYGMTEFSTVIAFSCKDKKGLHVCEDYFYPEIIDVDTLLPVEGENVGELVLTSLKKEGYPLIRYRTGDLTHFIEESCSCGNKHRRIAKIIGRCDDMMILKGVNVYPIQIEKALNEIEELQGAGFQVEIMTKHHLDYPVLKIESENQSLNLLEKIQKTIKAKTGIKFEIRFVEKYSLHPGVGKKQYVIDKRGK